MATSKTLKPTNEVIQIPAFADKPDQRLNSNCLDKEADAINELSDQVGILDGSTPYAEGDANSYTTTGIYHVGITQNSPTGNAIYGDLFVQGTGQMVTQMFTIFDGTTYVRQRSNATTWNAWQQFSLNSKFPMATGWEENADCNTYTRSGFYMLSTGVQNGPENWIMLIVLGTRSDTFLQLAFREGRGYIREYRTDHFTAWNQFAFTP